MLSLIVLLAGAALAQTPEIPQPRRPLIERLGNGLSIVIEQRPGWEEVSLQLWFRGGSRLDPPELAGRSRRALEHRLDMHRLRDKLKNARTVYHRDAFGVLVQVSPPKMAAALETLSRLLHVTPHAAPSDELPADQQTITELPAGVWQAGRLALLSDHPDAVLPAIISDSVRELSRDQLRAFSDKWFFPANALLVVAGDFEHPEKLLPTIERSWSTHAWQPERRISAPKLANRVELPDVEAEFPGLAFAWSIPARGAFESVYLDVLMSLITLQVKETEIRWQRESWNDAGVLMLYLCPNKRMNAVTLKQLGAQVESIIEQTALAAPEPMIFLQAAGIARRRYLKTYDSLTSEIAYRARAFLHDGNWEIVDTERLRLADPHVELLQFAAKRLLSARRVRIFGSSKAQDPSPAPPAPITAIDPKVDAEKLSERVAIRIKIVPGKPLATVTTAIHPASSADALEHSWEQLPFAETLRRYLDIHAATLDPIYGDLQGLQATVPGKRADSLIEWSARVLQTQLPAEDDPIVVTPKVEVWVVGDIDPELVKVAAREAWPVR